MRLAGPVDTAVLLASGCGGDDEPARREPADATHAATSPPSRTIRTGSSNGATPF